MGRKYCKMVFCSMVLSLLYMSCTPNSPEDPVVIKEINREIALNLMLDYFPYVSDTSYLFVNEQSGKEWRIRPFTQGSSSHQFPKVTSVISPDEFGESWDNIVNAEFQADNQDNTYRTSQNCEICTAGRDFEVHWHCNIWMGLAEGYGGSIVNGRCDSLIFWKIHTDTLTIPIITKYTKYNTGTDYSVPGACVRIVKGVGLYDFCLDGSSVWRRVE